MNNPTDSAAGGTPGPMTLLGKRRPSNMNRRPLPVGWGLIVAVALWAGGGILPGIALAQEKPVDGSRPEGGLTLADLKGRISNHARWLKGLGDPQLLNLMGLTFLREEQRSDPDRMVLQAQNLSRLAAAGANLTAAVLTGSTLEEADLRGVVLSHGDLQQARLSGARLEGAILDHARLDGADLRGGHLAQADLRNSSLNGADLRGADLGSANLSGSILVGADLSGANLNGANLANTDLSQALLTGADLEDANFQGAQMFNATLIRAGLTRADLSETQLFGADFSNAIIVDTDFSRANLAGANLTGTRLFSNRLDETGLDQIDLAGVVFEPSDAAMAMIKRRLGELARAKNLGLMTFHNDPYPLENLQRLLKQNDFPRQTLEITYALRRGQRRKASSEGTLLERVGSYLRLAFIEFPIEYGASPFRPFLILGVLIFVFGLIYSVPLYKPSRRFGEIWRVTPREQFGRFNDGVFKEPLQATRPVHFLIAFWYSFLSAMNIGGRIFNLDNLFVNIQPYEFHLRGTGWVRVLSGIQALITLYLILLTLLIYFEKVTF